MPRCKNIPEGEKSCYYTEKEKTPRGKGYVARYEKEGKRMKGITGKMYTVLNGRWVEVRMTSPRLSKLHIPDDPNTFNDHLHMDEDGDIVDDEENSDEENSDEENSDEENSDEENSDDPSEFEYDPDDFLPLRGDPSEFEYDPDDFPPLHGSGR